MPDLCYLTNKERQCAHMVKCAFEHTVHQYGNALMDCGHQLFEQGRVNNPVMKENENGEFVVVCENCERSEERKDT